MSQHPLLSLQLLQNHQLLLRPIQVAPGLPGCLRYYQAATTAMATATIYYCCRHDRTHVITTARVVRRLFSQRILRKRLSGCTPQPLPESTTPQSNTAHITHTAPGRWRWKPPKELTAHTGSPRQFPAHTLTEPWTLRALAANAVPGAPTSPAGHLPACSRSRYPLPFGPRCSSRPPSCWRGCHGRTTNNEQLNGGPTHRELEVPVRTV